jgi:hypothetical protein
LLAYNPHYLEMAVRCAHDVGDVQRILAGFAMFYRILALGAHERGGVPPHITSQTRDVVASMIGEFGDEQFVLLATELLRTENPCLLQMADGFASRHQDYLGIMQGFVLLYKALSAQAVIDGLGLAGSRGIDRPRGLSAPDS